jgi:hypothetical protein
MGEYPVEEGFKVRAVYKLAARYVAPKWPTSS